MDFLSGTKELYRFALDNEWDAMKEYLSKDIDSMTLLNPISEHMDNIIHFVVQSGRIDLVDKILDSCSDLLDTLQSNVNVYGNTVLHEAVISGNLEIVKLLVEKNKVLLEIGNDDGETPLFRAAAFGNTKIVKFLASQPGQIESFASPPKLNDVHRKRKDGASVLFAAVQGKHFGTALELLELDKTLTELEDGNRTSLLMLAKIPSALKGDYQMRIWKKLLYFCLPVGSGHNDDADNIEIEDGETSNQIAHGDTETGLQSEVTGRSVGCDDNPKGKDEDKKCGALRKVSYKIYVSIWRLINQGCPLAWKIWKEKRDHKFAYQLARILIRNDLTWENSVMRSADTPPDVKNREEAKGRIPLFAAKTKGNAETVEYLLELYPQALDLINHRKPPEIEKEDEQRPKIPLFAARRKRRAESVKFSLELCRDALEKINYTAEEGASLFGRGTGNLEFIKFLLDLYPLAHDQIKSSEVNMEDEEERGTPLLAAIRRGNVEFVKLIIEEYPQALEQTNHKNQNTLHVAAMYRQREIFDLVKPKRILMNRLARQIDVQGCTILHSVSGTKHYTGGTRSGPAYQLQEELEWFKNVEDIMPAYYSMLPAKNKKTAFEIFKQRHKNQLREAQQWMKDTSQSCSAVAVLVATVVFAAAFTVPGGTNDNNGLPILLYSPFFLFFTVMDVVSLSCSLTAVVMFLSILTSPFELEDFYSSLPRRLTFGFALLFMSVATTMLAFASTIFLVIRLDERRRWTTTLICCAAFFPVSVLALTHFPLFMSFLQAWKNLLKHIWNLPPCSSVIGLFKRVRTQLRKLVKKYRK